MDFLLINGCRGNTADVLIEEATNVEGKNVNVYRLQVTQINRLGLSDKWIFFTSFSLRVFVHAFGFLTNKAQIILSNSTAIQ
jgi:hypothetical protein